VTVGGGDIDSAHTATNYTATSADLDGHLAGVDTALGLKANSASLATVATSGAYADLSGSPALATVATSGLYTDLSSLPTLGTAAALDVGTSANNVVQLNGSAQLPAVDGSLLTGIVADVSTASVGDLSDVTITSASTNELLKFNGSAWVNASVAYSEVTGTPSLATVATSGSYADLSNTPTLGTASAEDVGTATGDVVQLVDVGGSPGLPVVDGSQLTGITADLSSSVIGDLSDVTITSASSAQLLKFNGSAWVNSSVAYAEVTGTPSLATVATTGDYADLLNKPTLGTASAEDVGTTIGDVVQLEDVGGSAALPAVDGSQLTGLNIDSVGDLGDVTITTPAAGDALIYDDVSSEWQNQALATVATTGAYSDLSGAPTLGTASALDVGTSANNVVQLNGSAQLPAVDGSLLTGITADVSTASIGALADVTITSASSNQVLKYDGADWVNSSVAYAEVTGTPTLATVATSGAYSDLSGLPTLGTASAEDVGTFAQTANNLSDLASASTARTNLGLGTASTEDVGTSAGNVVQLNGSAQLPAVDGSLLTGITADVSTASIGALADVTITSAANGDALVYDGSNWRDLALAAVATSGAYSDLTGAPALATVATTGDYDDLINAPTSMIGSAQFITDANALTLEAGKHYIIGTANATTKTMTLPDVTASGEYIRVTNWGDGQLVIQVDQVSSSAYLLVGNTIVQNGQVTIESRATVDLFGFDYTPAGYEPAWGVYFSSSIETNTRSFNATGQLPVYDATNKEFSAGDAGDLTLSYTPTNYTSAGNGIADHLGGIDTELGLKADSSSLATVATSGAYSDLSGSPTLGTAAALDVGTSANNVVQLDGSAKLPAVDGSALTNLTSVAASTSTSVSISVPTGSEAFHLLTPTGACAVTLAAPTPTTHDGKRVTIKNLSANTVTITATIDGQSSFALENQYSAITLIAYDGAWYIV
jgi:trimeric autotransporter adhesin